MDKQKLRGATRWGEYETLVRRAAERERRTRVAEFLLGTLVLLSGAFIMAMAVTGTTFSNLL